MIFTNGKITLFVMKLSVIGRCVKAQIRNSIVCFNSVFMVNMFRTKKVSPKVFFHHISMLCFVVCKMCSRFMANIYINISTVLMQKLSTLPKRMCFSESTSIPWLMSFFELSDKWVSICPTSFGKLIKISPLRNNCRFTIKSFHHFIRGEAFYIERSIEIIFRRALSWFSCHICNILQNNLLCGVIYAD